MNLEPFLSRLATVSFVALIAGLVANTVALALFAGAAAAFVVLITASDYARRCGCDVMLVARRRREVLPLAA